MSVGVDVTEELLDELIGLGISHSVEVNVDRARKRLAAHSKMGAGQWEKVRDRLVFVNENMQMDHLESSIYELVGELTETQEKVLEGIKANTEEVIDPISVFQMCLQTMNIKAKRVISMDVPVRTEVYLPL